MTFIFRKKMIKNREILIVNSANMPKEFPKSKEML